MRRDDETARDDRPIAAERAVRALFAAIESREVRGIEDAMAPTITWQNVPHPPAVGRPAVVRLLGEIITWSDDVRWDVVSASFGHGVAWVERVDRFTISGSEHAVRCSGVFLVANDVITEVRDYVDLGEWRARVAPVMAAMANRPPETVVRRHLDGVLARDPVRMSADYAPDAVLARPDGERRGWRDIADYFDTVPRRLDGSELRFGPLAPSGTDSVAVPWVVVRPKGPAVSGTDVYEIRAGRIARQTVGFDTTDF